MRIFLIKCLLRVLYRWEPMHGRVDTDRMDDWLLSLAATESGYKDYYTIRKRGITDAMLLGTEPREYWSLVGRLMELKQMNMMSQELLKKEDKRKKYEKKRQAARTDN